jgi:hypothetical protein
MSDACPTSRRGWPLERVRFALAGTVTLLSAALSALVASLLLTRLFGLRATANTPPIS